MSVRVLVVPLALLAVVLLGAAVAAHRTRAAVLLASAGGLAVLGAIGTLAFSTLHSR